MSGKTVMDRLDEAYGKNGERLLPFLTERYDRIIGDFDKEFPLGERRDLAMAMFRFSLQISCTAVGPELTKKLALQFLDERMNAKNTNQPAH